MTPEERASLDEHVRASGLAGDTLTPRASVVGNAEALADGDPDKALGLGARGRDARGVLEAVAALCGCSASLDERTGPGVIDPAALLDGLEAVGERLGALARTGGSILIATGHPTGVMAMYQAVARALAERAVKVLTPIEEEPLAGDADGRLRIRYLDGVGVLTTAIDLLHTHASWPMEEMLAAAPAPDLVLADHGFAGAAIARGLEVACFTDVNDPAIAVARADGLVRLVVPIDDNRPPGTYEPLGAYLVRRITSAA